MVDNVEIILSVYSESRERKSWLLYILFVSGKELMSCLLLFLKLKDNLIY